MAPGCPLADPIGSPTPDQLAKIAHAKLAQMDARLDSDQRVQVANLAVFGIWPGWFSAVKLGLRPMPEDVPQRLALLAGLDAIDSGMTTLHAVQRQRPRRPGGRHPRADATPGPGEGSR